MGQDFIVPDFFVGGRSCGQKRCVQEINVSRAGDLVHAGDKALTWESPAKGGGLTGMINKQTNICIANHTRLLRQNN